MVTWHVLVVKLDGQHVSTGFLWPNAQRERDVIALYELTHGRLAYSDALGRQRTCHRQPITAQHQRDSVTRAKQQITTLDSNV